MRHKSWRDLYPTGALTPEQAAALPPRPMSWSPSEARERVLAQVYILENRGETIAAALLHRYIRTHPQAFDTPETFVQFCKLFGLEP